MRIYMDVCCLNRPFDDQSQDKVRFETEAIISILRRCVETEYWKLIGSDVITLEISKTQDPVRKKKISLLHEIASELVKINDHIKLRAADFRKHNTKIFDSLHLAAAEYTGVDIFLTTDTKLIKAVARSDIKLRVANPLNFYLEVLNNEQSGD